MITRVKLISEGLADPIFIGIAAHEPDYKLSLAINRKFGFGLKFGTSIILEDEVGPDGAVFSKYSCSLKEREMDIDLIANRYDNRFLIKKLPNIDFLMVVHNPENDSYVDFLIDKLKEISLISAIFLIPYDSIKDKNLRYLI